MIRRSSAAMIVVMIVAVFLPAPATAWSWEAHRFIMRRAIEILPPDIKTFFMEHREEVVYRSIDPDLWRDAGWEEDHNHFVNFGAPEMGPFPFVAFPRDQTAALEKLGETSLKKLGTMHWRLQEMVLFSGPASHYIQDATQPLHASNHYHGQLTDQRGLHSRFELGLIERYESRITITPAQPRTIASVRDYAFETLLASYQKVDGILK